MFTFRTVVRWSATLLAAVGWGAAAWSWWAEGHAAGIHPGFMLALSVGITFTVVAGQWWRMATIADVREHQAVYGVGYQDGLSCGACPLRPTKREPGRLEVVRS